MADLIQELSKYNDPKDADYTIKLKGIIFNDKTSQIPDDYISIIIDSQNTKILKFSAFYCLFTQYRRFEQRYQLFELVDKYLALFDEELYDYLREIVWSQYYKFKFLDTLNKLFYKRAIMHGKKAIDCYEEKSDNIGCFNNFAEIVLDGLAHKNIVSDDDISNAIEYVDKAIYIQEIERQRAPYSRYYCSKARLIAQQGNYDDARKLIAQAISYESTDEKDSLIRIAHYHNVLVEITTKESLQLVDDNVAESMACYTEIKNKMDQQQAKYIEILSFFASIIALITGSIGIVLNVSDFSAASGLIICLAGCLTLACCILKLLFSRDVGLWRIAFSFLISILLLTTGFLLGKGIGLELFQWIKMMGGSK